MRNLNDEAAQWMSPNVPNGGRTANHAEKVGATLYHGDKKVQLGLEHQVRSFLPPSFPDPATLAGGTCSTDGPNSNLHSARRKLNPIFVEALMRWPTGLSGFERQGTAWTLWWRRMPSFVSALASQKPAQQPELF